MTPEQVLCALAEEDCLPVILPHWKESMAALPAEIPEYLRPGHLTEYLGYVGIDRPARKTVLDAAEQIASDPALLRLSWHSVWLTYESPEACATAKWPRLQTTLGKYSGTFYLISALAMVPRTRAFHRRLGIPRQITRETCRQVVCFARLFASGNQGRIGLYRKQLYWLRNYTREPYFRLGRLEFWLRQCPKPNRMFVYRNAKNGATVALAATGTVFDQNGYVPVLSDGQHDHTGWTARLVRDGGYVTGTAISPEGRALPGEVSLSLKEWNRVFSPDDSVLQMHIPCGGNMTLESCIDSMQRAVRFFGERFPEQSAKAIVCNSWIFNPDLERIFDPEVNLVRLLREVYLHPVPSGPDAGLWFIFLQDEFDSSTAPEDTSLRRAVLDFIRAGNRWRSGGMFVLPDDVCRLGERQYRRAMRSIFGVESD